MYLLSEGRLNKVYVVESSGMSFHNNDQIIEEGARLAVIRGCTDCHGADLGGKAVIEDPALETIYATNLTSGENGIGNDYSDEELVTAIRHGIRKNGTGLLVMPSQEFFVLSDADVNALVAFLRSVPPVDREPPEGGLTLLARALFMAGQLPPLAAEVIDHEAPRPEPPEIRADAEFGAYLATSCTGCHGLDFTGGPVPGAPPEAPEARNLTPAGNLGNWDEAGFINTLRTGVTPEGKQLDPAIMPWPGVAAMTDVELQALWAFLQGLPVNE
jgi:mono/diheme cytochrome c family protein